MYIERCVVHLTIYEGRYSNLLRIGKVLKDFNTLFPKIMFVMCATEMENFILNFATVLILLNRAENK